MQDLRARVVTREDFLRFDLVLAMDEENLAHLVRIAPAGQRQRIQLLLDYAPEAGMREVPDPYYGGDGGFENVYKMVARSCKGLVQHLRTA